jgi:hypothetical protein
MQQHMSDTALVMRLREEKAALAAERAHRLKLEAVIRGLRSNNERLKALVQFERAKARAEAGQSVA